MEMSLDWIGTLVAYEILPTIAAKPRVDGGERVIQVLVALSSSILFSTTSTGIWLEKRQAQVYAASRLPCSQYLLLPFPPPQNP